MSDSLWPHELQHARPPCPSPTPRVHPNSCPSIQWCDPAISSSVVPSSSFPQSLPASGSFPMSQLFTWGDQSIGVSALGSVLPMNTQDWSPLGWTGWIANTLFQLHKRRLYTWIAPDGQHRNQTYYILCSQRWGNYAAAAAKGLQSCLTLCDPIDGSPPGSPVPRILQARTLEWVAISFSNAWKWKVKVKLLSHVQLLVTPWTAAHQAFCPWDFPDKSTGVGCHCLLWEKLYTVNKNKTESWLWLRSWTPYCQIQT